MSNDWLYPLSSKTEHWFECKGERTHDTSPSSFERMIHVGGADDEWMISKNFRNVAIGDRIWPYYGTGDKDFGIAGLATISKVFERDSGDWRLRLHWDLKTTKHLLKSPYPAKKVRTHIPWPLYSVVRMPDALAKDLVGHVGAIANSSSSPTVPVYGGGHIGTITYKLPQHKTARLRHDAIVRPLMIRLESVGWKTVGFDLGLGSKKVDLAVTRKNHVLLIEVKTFSGPSIGPVRDAFAQLHEYRWLNSRTKQAHRMVKLWAVFESEPKPEEVQFLEAARITVSWVVERLGRFAHGPRSINTIQALKVEA